MRYKKIFSVLLITPTLFSQQYKIYISPVFDDGTEKYYALKDNIVTLVTYIATVKLDKQPPLGVQENIHTFKNNPAIDAIIDEADSWLEAIYKRVQPTLLDKNPNPSLRDMSIVNYTLLPHDKIIELHFFIPFSRDQLDTLKKDLASRHAYLIDEQELINAAINEKYRQKFLNNFLVDQHFLILIRAREEKKGKILQDNLIKLCTEFIGLSATLL